MEFLTLPSSSLFKKPQFTTSSLTSLTKKTPFKFHKTLLKSFPNSPFSTTLPLQNTQKLHISARFGGPTKRRNSLRKNKKKKQLKVDENDSKVSQKNPDKFNDPFHDFVDNQIKDSNFDSFSFEKLVEKAESSQIDLESSNLEKLREFGDSDLKDKLENWVDLYKKEVEFWGIGSNPIFTVFQDVNGNVERVLVDEDEILKRNGVEPLYFRKEIELDSFDEVKSKIEHAKFLAKELEGGRNSISKNSSVAKFVVSGESSGLVGRIRSIIVPQKSLGKVSRVGIAVVFGFVVVSMIRKLFAMGGKKAGMTSFEKEMLRRKKKSRLSKERLRKGSVEVMEEPLNLPSVVTERPPLDKEELLDSIREAKGLSNSLVVVDVGGAQGAAENAERDSKIREIQMMARHARLTESGDGSPSERSETNGQTSDTVAGPDNSILVGKLEKEGSDLLPLIGEEAKEQKRAGNDTNLVNNMSNEESSKTKILNGIPGKEIISLKTESNDAKFTSEKVSERNEDVETHSFSSEKIVDDRKSDDVSGALNLKDRIQSDIYASQLNQRKEKPRRRKPKIIRSVKEARVYLMQKHDKKAEVGDTAATAAVENEGNGYHNQRTEEYDRALDSFDANKVVDHAPGPKVSGYYSAKENESLATDINGLKIETESDLSKDRPFNSPISDNLGFDAALNLDKTINEMLKASDSSEKLDPITVEKNFCDTSEEANYPFLTEQWLEKVDKTDHTPKPYDLSETSDFDSGRNSSNLASSFTEESGVPHSNAHYDANLQKKASFSNDNGDVKHSAVGRDLNDAGSDRNGLFPTEVKDEDTYKKNYVESELQSADTYQGSGSGVDEKERLLVADKENWLEKNFLEVEPILKKIGTGFSNNYKVAREKARQGEHTGFDLMNLMSLNDDTELEWMQDDKLREIVFKVRDNELAGRDPFHSMDSEDKVAFFKGLENKAEEANKELSTLHEWLHSNIENIDYGADGISIYDPPEKVMPRWKGPPLDSIPEFLNNIRDQQEASSLQKVNGSTKHDNVEATAKTSTPKSTPSKKVGKFPKTVIESSDGSIKPGKKSGKEFWQHTKKWTRGFLESYNAETDPEVKATMKDIGKDLDRWITEKEIQDAADLMDNMPQKGKEFIEKKINKLKREMELFGPQAVVSKYREYAEEKEVDYLWWLDLPHVLCIELYTYEGEAQRVGFYSLEMATDLEIEPKPHHVIAFEDPGDCKNLCYIIQAHLEMLGNGKAFIIPQPPKDVYQQAKAYGFGVTVIRKGEVKLNVDQHLEEVEELITEIGSKVYHDKIMQERNVDVSALMKGVFGVSPPSKRKRKKRARKRPSIS